MCCRLCLLKCDCVCTGNSVTYTYRYDLFAGQCVRIKPRLVHAPLADPQGQQSWKPFTPMTPWGRTLSTWLEVCILSTSAHSSKVRGCSNIQQLQTVWLCVSVCSCAIIWMLKATWWWARPGGTCSRPLTPSRMCHGRRLCLYNSMIWYCFVIYVYMCWVFTML